MKKLWTLLSLTFILTACSAQASAPKDAAEEEKEKVSEPSANKQSANDVYVPNPQITDDRDLLEQRSSRVKSYKESQ
jgi:PBP1b-binding outer membrane lipoprotein LpoB